MHIWGGRRSCSIHCMYSVDILYLLGLLIITVQAIPVVYRWPQSILLTKKEVVLYNCFFGTDSVIKPLYLFTSHDTILQILYMYIVACTCVHCTVTILQILYM